MKYPAEGQVVVINFGWAEGQTGTVSGYGVAYDTTQIVCLVMTNAPGYEEAMKNGDYVPKTIIALSPGVLSFGGDGKGDKPKKVLVAKAKKPKIKVAKGKKVKPLCDKCELVMSWCSGCSKWEANESFYCDVDDRPHTVGGEVDVKVWNAYQAEQKGIPICGNCLQEVGWCGECGLWEVNAATDAGDAYCPKNPDEDETFKKHMVLGDYTKEAWNVEQGEG